MGKFRLFLTELSTRDTSVFSFLDNNFTKYQWIFTKLDMCFDIVEICFGIANGLISYIFDRIICPQYICILLSEANWSGSTLFANTGHIQVQQD